MKPHVPTKALDQHIEATREAEANDPKKLLARIAELETTRQQPTMLDRIHNLLREDEP